MTLGAVLARVKVVPKVGDTEIVLDRAGVAHILVVAGVRGSARDALTQVLAGDLDFMCLCEGLAYETREVQYLEVAPHATCIQCLAR